MPVGLAVVYLGAEHTFASGNRVQSGMEGEVAGAAEAARVKVKFPSNPGLVECRLTTLQPQKPQEAATQAAASMLAMRGIQSSENLQKKADLKKSTSHHLPSMTAVQRSHAPSFLIWQASAADELGELRAKRAKLSATREGLHAQGEADLVADCDKRLATMDARIGALVDARIP